MNLTLKFMILALNEPWQKFSMKKTDLARNSPAVENRTFGSCSVVRRVRMHINRVEPFVPAEELLPQRSHENMSPCQEHESDLRHAVVRVRRDPRRHRGSPQQLLVGHVVRDARWIQILFQSDVTSRRSNVFVVVRSCFGFFHNCSQNLLLQSL